MLYWVYDLTTTNFAILMIAVFVVFYWLGAIFLRPFLRQFIKSTRGANDVVGYILSCFCVFYGLLLGLIAVTAYQNSSDTSANVTREAAALSALYEDVSRYPDPYGQNLAWLLRDYTRYVIKICLAPAAARHYSRRRHDPGAGISGEVARFPAPKFC